MGVHPTLASVSAVCSLRAEHVGLPLGRVAKLLDAPQLPYKAESPASQSGKETVTEAAAVRCLSGDLTLLWQFNFEMQDGSKKPLCRLLHTYGEMLPAQIVWLEESQSHGTSEVGCVYSCAVSLMCLHLLGVLGQSC